MHGAGRVNAGSPQDSCLGLFLIYINNLPNDICNIANNSDFNNLFTNFSYNSVILLSVLSMPFSVLSMIGPLFFCNN